MHVTFARIANRRWQRTPLARSVYSPRQRRGAAAAERSPMSTTTKKAGVIAVCAALLVVVLFMALQHLGRDPRSQALIRDHNLMLSHRNAVLLITGFTNRLGWTLQTWMSPTGATFQQAAGEIAYSGPHPPPSRHGQLATSDLERVNGMLRELPSRTDSPPADRLVLISYRDEGRWCTYSYDTAALPLPVRELREMLEESLTSTRGPATNKVTSLDAAKSLLLHIGRQGRGASEFCR